MVSRAIPDSIRWLIVLLGCLVAGSQMDFSAQKHLTVTYIGNEGFLIESGGGKILIDALYREGVSGYVIHPQARRDSMEHASPPFDGIDLVLATHHHADHFDAGAVATHLRNNPEATFVSTLQAVERLNGSGGQDESISQRVLGVHPEEGQRFRKSVRGIDLEVINLHHGRARSVQNLGFLMTIGGWTILHIGDTEATVDDFLLYGLEADEIDIAFIPYWFLIADKPDLNLRKAIPAAHIVVMHVPPRDSRAEHIEERGGWVAMLDRIEKQYPTAVTYRTTMQPHTFPPSRACDRQ